MRGSFLRAVPAQEGLPGGGLWCLQELGDGGVGGAVERGSCPGATTLALEGLSKFPTEPCSSAHSGCRYDSGMLRFAVSGQNRPSSESSLKYNHPSAASSP